MFDKSSARVAVVIDDPSLRFNASHFLSFPVQSDSALDAWAAEPVHGHDFYIRLRIEGPLDESSCVVDFLAVIRAIKTIARDWDHDLILARNTRGARFITSGDKTTILYEVAPKLQYTVPTDSIRWLDGSNVSAEEIALELLAELLEKFDSEGLLYFERDAYRFELRLEEAPGCYVEVSC